MAVHAKTIKARVTHRRDVWYPADGTAGWMDTPRIVFGGTVSVIGIAFMMALVGRVMAWLSPHMAAAGMAAMFFLGMVISTIYWARAIRDERLSDLLEDVGDQLAEIQDRIIEHDSSSSEKLDLLVRNEVGPYSESDADLDARIDREVSDVIPAP